MKVIYNKVIPIIKGLKCLNLFGILFVRSGCTVTPVGFNHEAIHTAQMKEMLYIPFYILYLMEWMWNLMKLHDCKKAYYAISFECEAYAFQHDFDYLKRRKKYNQYRRIWL